MRGPNLFVWTILTFYCASAYSSCGTTIESPWAPLFKTERDTAYFWSGQTNGIHAEDIAANLACEAHGTTLEMRLEEVVIPLPPWDPDNPEIKCKWLQLSAAYAKQAVIAVIGKKQRNGGVWDTIELPFLVQNPGVTKIIRPLAGQRAHLIFHPAQNII
ncbi:561_t:CDS:1 [Paraglomus brasilianum]|uniref:561_t:CDS:1 n=1 Tax=Paraglomus brasilianum TaxID=144538 RepID=A0A9N9BA57_9GLOM|nr:561_t:CDS:1 [Paraglomus brasilianum]